MPRARKTEYVEVISVVQDDGPTHEAVIFQRGGLVRPDHL